MNGIDKIIERILGKAELDRSSLLAAADAEAKEIYESLKARADAEALEIVNRGNEQAQKVLERSAGSSELDSRRMLLDTKQKLIDQAFARAKSMLLELPAEKKIALLADLAAKALITGNEEIILGQADLQHAADLKAKINGKAEEKGLPANVSVSPVAGGFDGGLIIRQGNIETNCTFDTLLRMLRDTMAGDVAGILFG